MCSISFSDDSKQIALGFENGVIQIKDTYSFKEKFSSTLHSGDINQLAFSKDKSILLSGSYDNDVRIWNI